MKKILLLASVLALAACGSKTDADLQKACAQDALLQPIAAGVVAATVPGSGAAVLIDTTTIHPAIQALCAQEAATLASQAAAVVTSTPAPAPTPVVVPTPVATPAPATK